MLKQHAEIMNGEEAISIGRSAPMSTYQILFSKRAQKDVEQLTAK